MKHISSLPKKAGLLLSFIAVLLAGGAAAVRGQSALDGFDPNANDTISVVVVQPDGKILIGGSFTSVLGVTRNHIARLNPNGTLDTGFNPNANSLVYAIAVQPDGKVLVGGFFAGANSIGGAARNYIARLNATDGLADSFNPSADGAVYSLAMQADGKILVGGSFGNIGGQPRGSIARLDATTGLADAFNPGANATVFSIATQADGKIVVGGVFTGIGGQTRFFIAQLEATNGLADSFDAHADYIVRSVAVQADGKILAGGQFTSIGGTNRNYIARLDATTGLADSFNPNANGLVRAIAVQPDGKILAGGDFNGANSIGGATRNRIARLDATTGLADSFDPGAGNIVQSIAVQSDGKILAGGNFNSLAPNGGAPVQRNYIARMETDGRLDQTLNPSAVGTFVFATAIQPDGKILIGGGFISVSGVSRTNIARLNTDGTLDTAFNPNANGSVHSIVVQPDGKILVGGEFHGTNSIGAATRNYIARLDATNGLADSFNPDANDIVFSIAAQTDGKILAGGIFTNIGGVPRNYLARLDATTGLADSFNPNPAYNVNSIAVQADGKILVGGEFFSFLGSGSIGGQPRDFIARLDATTGLADSFDPDANNSVGAIAVQADGGILVGGSFTNIGGATRNHIARLNASTGLADSFDPNANSFVNAIAEQADGKILAGGAFTNIGGATRNYIARLDATTGSADSFDPNANNSVYAITVQADGKILTGGGFTGANSIGGQTRNLFARLSNDTAALQNLAVAPTCITWIRVGSGPQFTRVTFEFSANNVNYTPLGNGIPQSGSGNWTLMGLSLPIGQNIFIRARGYYRSGSLNGSESITESVRNAFLGVDDCLQVFLEPPMCTTNFGFLARATANACDGTLTNLSLRASPVFDPSIRIGYSDIRITIGSRANLTTAHGLFPEFDGFPPSYYTNILYTATAVDICGRVATRQIIAHYDFTPPTINCPSDIVVYVTNGMNATVNYTVTAADGGPTVILSSTPASGSVFPAGTNLVTATARDLCRNTNTCTFQIIVRPPSLNIQFSANTNVVLSWDTNFPGFTLESNTNLNTTNWSVVSPAPVASGLYNFVTNAVSGSARFFRLRQ